MTDTLLSILTDETWSWDPYENQIKFNTDGTGTVLPHFTPPPTPPAQTNINTNKPTANLPPLTRRLDCCRIQLEAQKPRMSLPTHRLTHQCPNTPLSTHPIQH